jgi:phosphoglycolate phosphatase
MDAFTEATIVFDLDGTLVDTAPDLARALYRTLDLEGLPHPPAATVRANVGHGARALIEKSAAFSNVGFSGDRLDQLTNAFISFYSADLTAKSAPFPGATDALDALERSGARLAVCTNKRTDLSRRLLEALGMEAPFAAIVGADSVVNRKPHPDHYREAVARAGGVLSRSLIVGDTAADVAAAHGAGAPAIIVGFGYADAPAALGADAVIAHFSELEEAARRLLAC